MIKLQQKFNFYFKYVVITLYQIIICGMFLCCYQGGVRSDWKSCFWDLLHFGSLIVLGQNSDEEFKSAPFQVIFLFPSKFDLFFILMIACKSSKTTYYNQQNLIKKLSKSDLKLTVSNTTHSISYVTVIKHCIIYQIIIHTKRNF